MTFPADDDRDAQESPPDSALDSGSSGTERAATQGDLWTQEPSAALAGSADSPLFEPDFPPPRSGKRTRRIIWEITQTLVLAVLIFLVVRTVAQNFRVEGPSMEPGLHDGQYLLVNKVVYFKPGDLLGFIPFLDVGDGGSYLFHGPKRGDVVVFHYPLDPDRDFIKRIIGVPGDTVRVEEGVVYVNGVALEEDYITGASGRGVEEQVVPEGNYFVLGDNRLNSSDSRSWGFVSEDLIIGKAMVSYWPLDDLGGVGNHSVDLGIVTLPLP